MWRGLALFCFAVVCAGAQTVINAESGPWTAKLDGTWRWHSGDDARWAAAEFDDSNWSAMRAPGPLPRETRYWIRLHVNLGPTSDPGLLLGPFAYAYDVYWDGRRIGQFGDLHRGKWFVPRWQTFHVPRYLFTPGSHSVAIRIGQLGTFFGTRQPRLNAGDNRVGDFSALHEAESASVRAFVQPQLLQLFVVAGFFLAGVYFLLLSPSVSQGAAFRWLGVILFGRALGIMCEAYANLGPLNLPGAVLLTLTYFGFSASLIAVIETPYALFRRPVPVALRCFECLLAISVAPVPIPYSALFVRYNAFIIPYIVPVVVAAAEVRKRTPGAKLSLVLFVIYFAATLDTTLAFAYGLPVPSAIYIAGFRVYLWDAALLILVPAISMQIQKANLRFRDEQERLRGEMEAARQVQDILLPSRNVEIPGFDIDASYLPATEVGGDFFQLFPGANNSLLVVVGDVSGKGMKAALLVSLIVGALQNRKSDQPSNVLAELNAVLLGRGEGGFTTCCCALFGSDGTLTLANAGHLAPYRNGEEIETPPALPLGIKADEHWPEIRIAVRPSDRILWFSDGVIEARNGKRDLLGFDRAQELATQSASDIARAAQQFGQEDDITVVSITRQKAAAYVA